MTPYEVKFRMCKSKKRYETVGAAIRAALGSSKSFAHGFRWYRCKYCGKFHVTSQIH